MHTAERKADSGSYTTVKVQQEEGNDLKNLEYIVTLDVSRSHGVESSPGHFSFAEYLTITIKLANTMGNSSPNQQDVILCDVFLPLGIT